MTPITITSETLWFIFIGIIAALGWALAYREYTIKNKVISASEKDSAMLTADYARQFSEVKNTCQTRIEELSTAHSGAVKDLEVKLAAALEVRESDLEESEQLVKDRIKEIEDAYKQVLEEQNQSLELYEKYIRNFDAAITLSGKKLRDLDAKGSFSSDDEIGFFFTNVSYLQEALNKFKIDKEIMDQDHAEKLDKQVTE